MKFHLPKKLMVAVLSAMVYQSQAATLYPSEVFEVAQGDTVTWTDYSNLQGGNAETPFVKDGEGTLVLKDLPGSTSQYYKAPIVAREGKVLVQDSTVYAHGAYTATYGAVSTWIMVGGKDAEMTFSNSSFNIATGECHMNVGTPDGSGTLNIEGGSNVKLVGSLFMGTHDYALNNDGWGLGYYYNMNGTAATDDIPLADQEPYDLTHRYTEGTYVDGYNGQDRQFGKGVLNVTDSTMEVATAFVMGYADVTISGDTAVVKTQTGYGGVVSDDSGYVDTYAVILGRWSGAESNLTITDGATMETNGQIRTDRSTSLTNTKNTITVSEGATLKSKASINLGIAANGAANGNTTKFEVLSGGKVEAVNTYLGNPDGTNDISVVIDEQSSYSGKDFLIRNAGVSATNSGQLLMDRDIKVSGGQLTMQGAAAKLEASALEVSNGGTFELAGAGDKSITVDTMSVDEGGVISLNDGNTLSVTGALTLAQGAVITVGDGYQAGDILVTTTGSFTDNGVTIEFTNAAGQYVIENGQVIITELAALFNQDIADTLTVSNWGIATASRAFVNAVRGQRSNTGCIANGRGTAWVAVLAGSQDIGCSDIDLTGGAVGVDVKVGEQSSVGIALGYVEGDVKPAGLQSVDQEGAYVALYGEHGLRKLSSTSCLSLDWVAAYGNTESDAQGVKWEQDSLQLNTRLNWNKKLTDKLCMSVFGGLEYFASDSDTVDGVKTGSIQNLRGEIGVGARYVAWGAPSVYDGKGGLVSPGCEKLVLHGELRYMNDMVRSNPVIRMDGMSGGGENPGRSGMGIEAGATYRIGERWSASANYGFNAMDDSREHRVNVGASYTF